MELIKGKNSGNVRPLTIYPGLKAIAFLFLFLCVICGGCLKYQDGPVLSLRTKYERLANFWVIDKYAEDGEDKTDEYKTKFTDFTLRFGKDNSFDFYGTLNGKPYSRSGEWHFVSAKRSIRMQNQASDSIYDYRINKLMETQLWLEQKDTNTSITKSWHYKKKRK